MDQRFKQRVGDRLARLYGKEGASLYLDPLLEIIETRQNRIDPGEVRSWDETDIVLITYGDMVRSDGDSTPLAELRKFLCDEELDGLINTVHILPFFPYSSDDGFSVIDYSEVDPALGSWDDIESLGRHFRLAFDLVLNHASSKSEWFQRYLNGEEPYSKFFIEANPGDDHSLVVRPRSLPLLTPYETSRGLRYVWTTFSADQVDLNFKEPLLLLRMLEILLEYAAHGGCVIRLDAIAFLWKQSGTNCLHHDLTHEVVKLMRDVLEYAAPHVWILTETNVPHEENISYFGNGDEAHLVYQFSLPPLLLDSFIHQDATHLQRWLSGLAHSQEGMTFLNFTASHDGIGVRPLEGLVPPERVESLVNAVRQRGGFVSTRRREDGVDVPYELNITYVDALAPEGQNDIEYHARRFLATQAIMLALRGIPALYFHSLVGTRNDREGAKESGYARRINRRKFQRAELDSQVRDQGALSRMIYDGYRKLLHIRRQQPAFNPLAEQNVLESPSSRILMFERISVDGQQRILIGLNVADAPLALSAALTNGCRCDLISGETIVANELFVLAPGQAVWLSS